MTQLTDGLIIQHTFQIRYLTMSFKYNGPKSYFHSSEMEATIKSWFSLSVLLPLLFFSKTHVSTAAETISLGQALSGNQTISSKGGIFELGFFTPGNSKNYYIGIWYKQFPQDVVWVANRETPLSNKTSSVLRINQDGNLVLLNLLNRTVWSTNITSIASNSTTAELLDTGDLVLRDGSNSSDVIWQSFDYPTNTWLPKGRIGRNKITGERQRMTSWKNSEDPAPGLFSLEMDPSGLNQFVLMWNRSKIYWQSGVWTGTYFSSIPGMAADQPYKMSLVETQNRTYATYEFLDNTSMTRNVMGLLGQVQQCTLLLSSQTWSCFWSMPTSRCEIYSYCSSFGICTQPQSTLASCSCLHGFEPGSQKDWDSSIWSGGCKRRTPLQCGRNTSVDAEKDGFFVMRNVQLPVNQQSLTTIGSAKDCELYCLNNCSCTAYAYDSSCSVWNDDLINLKQLSVGDVGGGDLYLRLAAIDLQDSGKKKTWVRWVIVGVAVGCVLLFSLVILFIWIYQRRQRAESSEKVQGSLVSFNYRELQNITKNFSEKLGRGSFGSVFKGSLPDSTPVAVKKLEGYRQGEKQFRAEVSTIGAIQHVNLIRLCGFCSQGNHRMLVYDYMPKGSLDSQLFHKKSETLDWNTRYQIALGTARGLAYLHEKCRERIIHCDIKPENVLLDSSFLPKVADFGMAKLVGREFSRVLTSMRGTIGYLAPEWISGVAITPKADVYSYGMMLFEIISGKRNSEHSGDGGPTFFPTWAAGKIIDGEFLALLDDQLKGNANMEELGKASRVACWCIQDNEDDRPSMGLVVQILEGVTEVNIPPIPRALKIFTEN